MVQNWIIVFERKHPKIRVKILMQICTGLFSLFKKLTILQEMTVTRVSVNDTSPGGGRGLSGKC